MALGILHVRGCRAGRVSDWLLLRKWSISAHHLGWGLFGAQAAFLGIVVIQEEKLQWGAGAKASTPHT